MGGRQAVVCVPARNEAEHIGALVRSLAAQTGLGPRPRLRVVVVANNCTDDTVSIIRAADPSGSLDLRVVEVDLPPEEAHVGTARRLAMETGAAWLEADGHDDGFLISTDADAIAPPDWVAANLAALDGVEAVGGRLCVDLDRQDDGMRLTDLHRRIERYWSGVRALEEAIDPPSFDPMPRHGDHTAASLAVPVWVYRAVGGLPALRCGEDNALVARIRWRGGRVRHCPSVRIVVSPRLTGRVEGGMASEMARRADLSRTAGRYLLPSGAFWAGMLDRRATLRSVWRQSPCPDPVDLHAMGLDEADLAAIDLDTCVNDIAFVERAMTRLARPATDAELVDIDAANRDIERLLAALAPLGLAS